MNVATATDFLEGMRRFWVIVAVMATLPFWFEVIGGHVSLAETMLVWMLFAIGYDVELGYAGQLSIGHTVMYGLGGYATGIVLIHLIENVVVAVVLSTALVVVTAAVIGRISHQTDGLYFALVTLAFTMMFFFLTTQLTITGGHDGLAGIPRFGGPVTRYYTLLITFGIGGIVGYWVIQSPYGRVLRAVKENEQRLEHLGYNPMKYKVSAFILSGIYAGIAGSMLAMTSGFIGPEVFFWITAFQIVVFTIMGGPGTITGPVLAAGIFTAMESILGRRLGHWDPILGIIFISIIIFYPGGVYQFLPGGDR